MCNPSRSYRWHIVSVSLIILCQYLIGFKEFKHNALRPTFRYFQYVFDNTTESTAFTLEPTTNIIPSCRDIAFNLTGRIPVVQSPIPNEEDLEGNFTWLSRGHYQPESCQAIEKVAIIMPYRNRHDNLMVFLQHMHPIFHRQGIHYGIFVAEQYGNDTFNKAIIMNAAFKEALKLEEFGCFIFHDVDLLLEDDRHLYRCVDQPRHMSVAINTMKYRLPYHRLVGGVFAITRKHFELVNGYSNEFWGWGGEDDDMYNRLKHHNLNVSRDSEKIARYIMLGHKKEKPSANRYAILRSGKKRFDLNGLSNLKYSLKEIKMKILYTRFLIQTS